MKTHATRCLFFVSLLWLSGAAASEPTSFDALLNEADRIRTSEPAKFKHLVTELDSRAEDASPAQKMKLRLMHAYSAMMTGETPAAIADLSYLKDTAPDADLRYRAGALLANAYAITREFKKGLQAIEATLNLANKVTDREIRHYGFLSAGVLYNQVGEFGLGRKYANQVLLDKATPRSQCIAGNLRLESLQGLGDMPDNPTILSAIQQCESQNEPILAGFSRTYLARKHYAEDNVTEAIEVLEKHLPEVEKTAYPRLIGEYHALLSEYQMAKGDVQAAEQHANGAIAQSSAIASSLPLVIAYRTLYEIAEHRQNSVLALQHYRLYAEADKAHFSDVKSREMAYQIVRHQSLQQSQQIELLNQQNKVLQLQQRMQEQSAQNSRVIVTLLVLLLASIGLWAYKTKRVQMSLRRMAETDALTDVCNRHHFTAQSELALTQYARAGEDVALVMFDLDHFKSINDRFGHVTGDWVLRHISDACKHFCRRIDHLGRIGGEEFAILLAGCDLRQATRIAEDCRVRIASIDTQASGYKFVVTASFGVTATSLSGYDLTKLLSHADQMLYRAKREGRNRVFAYDGDTASEFKEHAATRQEELLLAPEGQHQAELPRIA